MSYRKTELQNDNFYHICNHGIDTRDIFLDQDDLARFILLLASFNDEEPIGGIYNSNLECHKYRTQGSVLVDIICYCLNPNHFHLMLRQVVDNGIKKFIHRVAGGYVKYFNNKYSRSGPLFRGPFRAFLVATNERLLETSAYININNRVHNLPPDMIWASSWEEYLGDKTKGICSKNIVLEQFECNREYKEFMENILPVFREAKDGERELKMAGII